MLVVIMLNVVYTGCHYAECRYAGCHYAEFRYAECRGALLAWSPIFIF